MAERERKSTGEAQRGSTLRLLSSPKKTYTHIERKGAILPKYPPLMGHLGNCRDTLENLPSSIEFLRTRNQKSIYDKKQTVHI